MRAPRFVVLAVLPLVLSLLPASAGCGKHLYSRDDLDVSLFQHHNNLRWGRLENAALNVKPDMRGAFLSAWAKRMQDWELQDMEVSGVTLTPDGDAADVVVNVTIVDKVSMTVKNVIVTEHWVRTDDGWMSDRVGDLQ